MSTTSHVTIDEGSTTQLPTYDISEDAATKKLSRSVLNKSDGTELIGQQTAANSVPVILPSATITTLTPPAALTNYANETGGNLAAIKADTDKIPSQGQALAAASTPVVLPAAQITTLTPPTNAGYALDASLTTIDTDIKSNITLHAGANKIGQVAIDQTTPGTTNLVALAANQSVNSAQVAGTTTSVNSGNKDAGTQRVVIASDQPAFTVNNAVTDVAPSTGTITVVDSGSTSTLSANGQNLVTGSATASSSVSFALAGIETIKVQVTGTWTGTLTSEASIDGGTTWIATGLHQGAFTTSTFTANFVGGTNVSGATNYRLRATATITGTATVKVIESFNTASVYLANAAPSGNYISLNNSSSATLLAAAAFTGTSEDVSNFSEMRISVIASHASATNGLSIQQSSDNSNWDVTDTYTIAAGTTATFVVPRQARYFRIVYTNGGTNQTSFRLQSILNRTSTAPSSQRSQDGYTNETDLVQNWTFNSAWNGTTWDRVPGDTTGLHVKQVAGTATLSNVAGSASSVTLLAANTSRIGAQVTNDSSALLYIKFGTTASTTSYTVVLAGAASAPFSYYEVPAGYTGRIDGIWASATGNARVTEEA